MHLETIITNQYGNYIIQYTFTLNDFVLKAPLRRSCVTMLSRSPVVMLLIRCLMKK